MKKTGFHQLVINILFLVFLSIPLDKICSQSPVFFHFNVEDGLPSSEVYDIHQDAEGYIWFATDHGLSRYDGNEFRTFTKEDGLSDNTVFDIREDHNGRLWLSTYSGGISFCEKGECGAHPVNDKILEMLGSNYPDNLILDEEGNMLVTISLSNQRESKVLKIDTANQLSFDPAHERYQPPLDATYELKEIIATKNKIENREILAEFNHEYVNLRNGAFLLASSTRLYYLDSNKNKFFNLDFKDKILTLFEDQQQNIWVSPLDGEGVFLIEDQDFSKGLQNNFLPGKTISDILQDHEGNYWFSTLEDGVFFLPSKDFISLDGKEIIKSEKVLAIGANDKEDVYFSTFSRNLFKLTGQDKVIEKLSIHERLTAAFDILFHSNGKIYFSNGIVIDGNQNYFLGKKRSGNSKVVFESSNGDVLFGRIRGINVFREDQPLDWSPTNGQNFKFVYSIGEDEQNQLWLGTLSGLFKYSNDSLYSLKKENPLYAQRVTKIVKHASGNLFLATKGAGLLIKTSDSLYQISITQGLNSNLLKTIFIENDSTLWIGSNKGINRLIFELKANFQLKKIDRFRRFDGLPSEEINGITKARGLIWLATNKGVTYFNPDKIIPNHIPPKVHITQVQVNGKDTSFFNPLILNSRQNDISINFLALSYRAATENRYRFKLNGYDEDWVETGSKEVKYTNLPSGEYEFQLTACNSNGIWNEAFQSFDFTIRKHFTRELWFIALIVFASFVGLFLIIKRLLKRQRIKESLARRMVESEQKALRAQINPHFIFNAMNSIQYFISDNDKKNAEIYLSRFSTLMRKVLEDSKKNLISLEEEIESLENYLQLEKLRFPDKFEYEIIRDPQLDIFETEIPPMIIQPFLENAIWHGLMPKKEKGFLSIKFQKQNDNIIACTIQDNGIGRKESLKAKGKKRHQSTGIHNVTERIQVVNTLFKTSMSLDIEDLFHPSGKSEGTIIRIYFPLFKG